MPRFGWGQRPGHDKLGEGMIRRQGCIAVVSHLSYMRGVRIVQPDHVRLAEAVSRDFPAPAPSTDRAWFRPPALRVIDCVLSLNRHYDRFVVPRLDRFEQEHPTTTSVKALRQLIASCSSAASFCATVLRYRDPARATTLSDVVDYLLDAIGEIDGNTEDERLAQWARDARPGDYLSLGISGFGLAGFQYLRMLFGADTTKPDVHVRRYVGHAIRRPVSDVRALYLLERAAKSHGRSLRDLDTSLWEWAARGEKTPRAV